MEINYDLIIKYLVKKPDNVKPKIKSNTFITQKSIFNYSTNFPEKFKELFTDKFYRYGMSTHDYENANISFWSSFLTLIDKNFIIPYNNDEFSIINQFKNQLVEKYMKSKLSSIIKTFDKNDLRERLKLDPDVYILQYITDILDINFIIFDFESTNIYSVYHKDLMNPWKQTVLLSKSKNYWEPIMMVKNKSNTQKLFDYNDNIIKKIIHTENLIECFEKNKTEKDFMFINNINDVLTIEKKKLKIPETQLIDDSESSVKTDDENNIFVKKDELEKISKLNKSKINKMKVQELWDIIGKLNIIVEKKNPTKSILMDSILSKLETF